MKNRFKIFSLLLTFCIIFGTNTTAFAKDNSIILQGENGSFSISPVNNSPTSSRSSNIPNYTKFGDHIEITTDITEQYSNGDIYTKLNLPEGAYTKKLSDEMYEKEVIMIYNSDDTLLGLVDIPIITLEDGSTIYGENEVHGNTIVHTNTTNTSIKPAVNMMVSVFVSRDYKYYFYDIGYNNDEKRHDFWMQPKGEIFVSEKAGYGTYEISWNSLDNGMKGKLTGADRTKWLSNPTSLKLQYRCHYDYATPQGFWNIEEWRNASSYSSVVAAGCNP